METYTSIVKHIWIADDDPDDLLIFKDVLYEVYSSVSLTTFNNGDELLKSLTKLTAPDLLFLDINMPFNGHDCLKEIRNQNKLQSLPIIIYSSSIRDLDVTYSYGLGANLYIRKPSSYNGLGILIRKVLELDWRNVKEITKNQFIDGKYVPFMTL